MYSVSAVMSAVRTYMFKIVNGRNVTVDKYAFIRKSADIWVGKGGRMHFGRRSRISENAYMYCAGGYFEIGENSFINVNSVIGVRKKLVIGSNCAIGPNVTIFDHDHKFSENGLQEGYNSSEIIIGNNCWIGANVTILRGAHIGDNCVIGAGSIVMGNIGDGKLVTSDRTLLIRELRR